LAILGTETQGNVLVSCPFEWKGSLILHVFFCLNDVLPKASLLVHEARGPKRQRVESECPERKLEIAVGSSSTLFDKTNKGVSFSHR